MANVQLSIATNYVANWGLPEAFRELFQNGQDKEVTDPDNTFNVTYNALEQEVRISNRKSVLERKTLLLGSSTKATDKRTVGQFGEGYKLALLVLTRLNKPVTIYNYGKKETWIPKIGYSRNLGADSLSVDIKKHMFTSVPDNNLTIVVKGITEEEWAEVKKVSLRLQDDVERRTCSLGSVLTSEAHMGNIYVSGLFVTHDEDLSAGYDFPPERLTLGRDRNLIEKFDIQWACGSIWQALNKEKEEQNAKLAELIYKESPDVKFHHHHATGVPANQKVNDEVASRFIQEHGDFAYPVTNESEARIARMNKREPVIVGENLAKTIQRSQVFVANAGVLKYGDSPVTLLNKFWEKFGTQMCLIEGLTDAWDDMVDEAQNWGTK